MTAQTLPNNRIPNKQESLYSISEAAKLLGISPSTLRRWEDEGRLVPVRTSGGSHRRYSQDDVKRLLKSFRQDTDSRRTNDVKPQIEIPEYPLGTGGRLPPKIPVRTLEQIRQPLRRRKRVPHRLVDVTLLLISLALLYSVVTPLAQERLYRVFASPLQNLIYSTVKIVSPQQAELIKPGIMNPIVDVNDVLEYVEMTDQEGEIETGLRAKLTLIGSEMITQTLRVVKEGTFNTARFLGSIFLGPGERYLINPLGDAFLRKLNVSGRSDLDGGIAVDTDNFTVSGKTGATEIKGEVTAGEAFKVSFDPGVQSGDLTGIEVDFSKIVDPATWTLYGVHIDDAIGDASTAYGVYVEGENWDYGIYSEDDIATAESLKVGRNMEIEGKTEIGGTLTIGDETTISGNLLPGIDSTFDIGAVDQEWANLYVDDITAGTVASGDTTLSSLTVTNQTDLQGDVLDTTGNLTLNDTVDISGALNVTNSTTLSDTLTVAGATTLSSTLDVVGDTSIGGDLSVTGSVSGGAADFSSLIVTGTSDLRGDVLDTTGNLTLNDTVDISGALNVTGAGTFSSTLYADGGISTTAGDLSLTSATGTTSITDQLALPTQGSTGGLVIGGDADLYRGGSSRLETTSYLRFLRGAAGNLAVSTAVSGDTNDRFSIYTDGDLKWGDGTVGQDTNFYRSAADTLKTDDTLVVGTQLELPTDKKVQFRDPQIYMHSGEDGYLNLIADSAVRLSRGGAESGKLEFWDGSAFSINLYAGTTNVLETDDSLWVGTEIRAGYWQALGSVAFKTLPSGDTSWARFFILNSGELQWGPGNAPGDTNLYRSAADTLKTDDSFAVAGDLTASGQGFFNHLPTQAHTGTWAIGSGTWNQDDASIYINPSTSVGDGNLIAGAVGGLVKFAVDTEGDIHGNNLILAGSISQATTTIAGNLTVQGDTTLGDASGDTLTIYPDTTQFISGSSTLDIYTASGDTTLTIDNTGTGVAHLTITGDLTVGGDDIRDSGSNIVLSFDGSGKIDSVATLLTGTALTFRDAQLTIYSSTDGQLDIDADTEVEITAPTTQIVSSTTFDVDGGAITIDGSTLSLDSTDTTNLTMTANAAGDKTMTIAASNSGAGAGLISISSDGDLSLDTSGGTLYLNNTNNQAINTGTGNFVIDTTSTLSATSATTINIATADVGSAIAIGTEGTTADTISVGNTNATTTLALTGGDDWSMAATGVLTMSASAAQTTAIIITDPDYTNALSIGDNVILGTTAAIDFTNFDVATTGHITVQGGYGLDTNAAGALNIGTTTQNALTLGRATINTTINGANIILGAQANAADEAVRADRNLIAGVGLTGGGTLIADRTFDVGAGDGIDVAADSIAVDVTDILGTGLSETSNNINVVYGSTAGTSAQGNVTHTGPGAGTGLTGGGGAIVVGTTGTFTTINAIGGTCITANPNDLAVTEAGCKTNWDAAYTHSIDTTGAVHGATSANTVNMIVRRDASGNFSAGTITATTFSGNLSCTNCVNATEIEDIYLFNTTDWMDNNGPNAGPTAGTLVFAHPTNYNRNSIVFTSRINYGSDYGYIEFRDDDNDSGEALRLTIGTSNDADDDLVLDPSGRLQIAATNMTLDTSGHAILAGNLTVSGGHVYFGNDGDIYDAGTNYLYTPDRFDSGSQMRSPIYYDRNDTAYYFHGDSETRMYRAEAQRGWGTWVQYDATSTAYYVDPSGTSAYNDLRANIFYSRSATSYWMDPEAGHSANFAGYIDATYFRDENSTGYYTNPASTSNINAMNMAGNLDMNGVNRQIFIEGDNGWIKFHLQSGGEGGLDHYVQRNINAFHISTNIHYNDDTNSWVKDNSTWQGLVYQDYVFGDWGWYVAPAGTTTLDCEMRLTQSGELYIDGSIHQGGADVAEYYKTNEKLAPGEIVQVSESKSNGDEIIVEKADEPASSRVIGVISTNPGMLLSDPTITDEGSSDLTQPAPELPDNFKPVAIVGQAPTRVSTINGAIKIGDSITSSEIPGVGMKAAKAGPIVGKALEPYDNHDPNAVGKIIVFVSLGWYDPGALVDSDGDMAQVNADGTATKIIAQTVEAKEGIFEKITATISAVFEKITAKTAEIAEAVIQTLRVEKAEIKTLEVGAISTGENSDTAGSGVVKEGEGKAVIESLAVTERSKIYVTFTTDYAPATRFWVAEKKDGESFTVELDAPVAKEAKFDWWIVN